MLCRLRNAALQRREAGEFTRVICHPDIDKAYPAAQPLAQEPGVGVSEQSVELGYRYGVASNARDVRDGLLTPDFRMVNALKAVGIED